MCSALFVSRAVQFRVLSFFLLQPHCDAFLQAGCSVSADFCCFLELFLLLDSPPLWLHFQVKEMLLGEALDAFWSAVFFCFNQSVISWPFLKLVQHPEVKWSPTFCFWALLFLMQWSGPASSVLFVCPRCPVSLPLLACACGFCRSHALLLPFCCCMPPIVLLPSFCFYSPCFHA